jgi:N-acylneuraminate cytidylyltransferase
MKIAVIPARGGSKRIPRKNIKDFFGKPIIAWSIEAAIKAEIFDHVIVSTDESEIADVAKQWGASVPFIRPKEFSDDHATTQVVINHCISEVTNLFGRPDYVCCILATAPFLQSAYLKAGLAKLLEKDLDFVFSITGFEYPIPANKITGSSKSLSRCRAILLGTIRSFP